MLWPKLRLGGAAEAELRHSKLSKALEGLLQHLGSNLSAIEATAAETSW
jgi:hypothetical protein